MPIVIASLVLGSALFVALLLRRPTDAPSIEKRATHGYGKGFKGLMLVCLLAHTAFFTAYAYGFATEDSTVWQVGVWEFGAFAILAWWLVLEAFFTVGWIDAEGVGIRKLGVFERSLKWSEVERVRESRVRGALMVEGGGKRIAVPNQWGLNAAIAAKTSNKEQAAANFE